MKAGDSTTAVRPRRLLMVANNADMLSVFLLPYARHFRSAGWQVDAVAGEGGFTANARASFDRFWYVPWSRRPTAPGNMLSAPSAMRRIIRDGGYDIVHTHTPIPSFATRCVAATINPERRPRVIYTAHGFHFHPAGSVATNALYQSAERLAGRWTDRLIVINDEDRRAAARLRLVPPNRLVYMPGIGLDLEWYRFTPQLFDNGMQTRAQLHLGEGDALFSVIAEMQPGKNHVRVLEALAQTGDRRYHLAFAGEGPTRPALEARADRLGIRNRVHFLGWLSDVRPLIVASAATVLISRREGLSRAVMESLALGVPVIGSPIRGVAELVGADGGRLVAPDDVPAVADAFKGLAPAVHRSPQLPPSVHVRLQRYGIAAFLQQHEALYEEVLAR
jgi:glycosyltransferase involved in cell wall biosynthesis